MREIFILSCAPVSQGGGVYKYALDGQGTLEKRAYLPCDKPMYAVNDGKRLHILLRDPFGKNAAKNENARAEGSAAEEEKYSGYFTCNVDFSNCSEVQSTLGECACHLAVDGDDVYIANYLSGNIVKNCHLACVHEGQGVNLPRQDMPHTHFAAFTPDKKYVLCCDLGLDAVFVYDRNLNEVSRAKVPDGYGVRHLVFSNDGHTVYAANELVPSVSVFSFDGKRLSLKNTVALPCEKKNSTAAAIRLSEDGKTLYVSVRGENAVFVFDVDGGNLQLKTQFGCGGDSPRDFDLFGDTLVCCNENSDNVTVVNAKEYRITGSIRLQHPLCVLAAEKLV
ncbi:MAG: beta-propeller fold lactonase family protein [Candidatus Scatosoma sp.]